MALAALSLMFKLPYPEQSRQHIFNRDRRPYREPCGYRRVESVLFLRTMGRTNTSPAIPLTTTLPEEILVVPEEIDLEVAEKEVEEAMMMTMTMMMNQMRPNKRVI